MEKTSTFEQFISRAEIFSREAVHAELDKFRAAWDVAYAAGKTSATQVSHPGAFDMDRMKAALASPSIPVPDGLSREDFRALLLKHGKEPATDKTTFLTALQVEMVKEAYHCAVIERLQRWQHVPDMEEDVKSYSSAGFGLLCNALRALQDAPPAQKNEALVTGDQATVALDDMDDYARMDVSVNASGPRGVLERYISQRSAAQPSAQGDTGPITHREATQALEELDGYARMPSGRNAAVQCNTLERYIAKHSNK